MHLLALLIAAVFSSQFVSVNAGETFTYTPKKVHSTDIADIVITNTGTAWTGPVKILVNAVGGTTPVYTDGDGWYEPTGTDPTYTTEVDFDDHAPDANGKLYVWIALDTGAAKTVIATPAVIEVVDTWWVTVDALNSLSTTIASISIRPPLDPWEFHTGEEGAIKFYLAKAKLATPPTTGEEDELLATGTATLVTARSNVVGNYELASLLLPEELNLGGLTKIFMYVSYQKDDSLSNAGAITFDAHVEEIPVTSTVWSLGTTDFKDTELTKLPAITVSSNDKVLWKNNMKLRVVRAEGTADEKEALLTIKETEETARANTAGDKTYAVAAGGNLNGLKILTGDLAQPMSLKVYLVIDEDVTHDRTVSISVTRQAPDFTLVTATLAETAIVVPVTVTLTAPASVRANAPGAGWDTNTVTAIIKKDKLKPTGAATGFFAVGTQASPGANFFFEFDLTTLAVTDDLKELYIYAGTAAKTKSGHAANVDPTWLETPATITFQQEAALEGEVVLDPEEVAFEDLAAPGEIKVSIVASTANTLAVLGANSRFKIEYTDDTPTTKSVSGVIKAHETTSNTIDYYYIDNPKLDNIGIPDEVGEAKVYIYPTGTRNAIETVLGITSDTPPPEEPEFVLDPAYVLFADVASLPVIEVKPDIEVSWPTSGMKLTFSYEAPTANAAITYDIAVTKVDTKYVTAAEASLASLLIEEEDLPADITVTFHDGTKYLEYEFTFKVLGKEPPAQVTFTIAPNEIDYADALKTEEIVITPAANHGWPTSGTDMKFRISNPTATPVPNPVTGTVTIAAGATAETKKYSIPDQTAISGLFAAAPTANVVLKIEVTPDGDTWLNHKADYTVTVPGKPEAAMGVSPLLSLLAALVFLFVKLF